MRPVVPAARKKSGLSFAQMDLQPGAVELDFMDPGVSGGRPIAQGRQCRRDELRKGTGLRTAQGCCHSHGRAVLDVLALRHGMARGMQINVAGLRWFRIPPRNRSRTPSVIRAA